MAKITQNTDGHSCTMTMGDTNSLATKTSKRCAVLLDLTSDGDNLFADGARKTVPCPFTSMGPLGGHLRPMFAQVLRKA